MTKAAVFDLDGVLLDSMGIWNDLGARYLRSLGVTPEEGLNEILFSMSMEQGAEYLHTHYALPQSAAGRYRKSVRVFCAALPWLVSPIRIAV